MSIKYVFWLFSVINFIFSDREEWLSIKFWIQFEFSVATTAEIGAIIVNIGLTRRYKIYYNRFILKLTFCVCCFDIQLYLFDVRNNP